MKKEVIFICTLLILISSFSIISANIETNCGMCTGATPNNFSWELGVDGYIIAASSEPSGYGLMEQSEDDPCKFIRVPGTDEGGPIIDLTIREATLDWDDKGWWLPSSAKSTSLEEGDCCKRYDYEENELGYGWIEGNCNPDSDGDGILNDEDNCKDVPNSEEQGTCVQISSIGEKILETIIDQNGFYKAPLVNNEGKPYCTTDPNVEGLCPIVETASDSFTCFGGNGEDDSTSQRDNDEDGVGDVCDNCYKVSNEDQEDEDDNGIGDVCEEGWVEIELQEIKNTNAKAIDLESLITPGEEVDISLHTLKQIFLEQVALKITAPPASSSPEGLTIESLEFDTIVISSDLELVESTTPEITPVTIKTETTFTKLKIELEEPLEIEPESTEEITISSEQITIESAKVTLTAPDDLSDLQKEFIKEACYILPDLSPETIKVDIPAEAEADIKLTDIESTEGEWGESPCKPEIEIQYKSSSGNIICKLKNPGKEQEESYDGKLIALQYLEVGDPLEEEIASGELTGMAVQELDYAGSQYQWETVVPEPKAENGWIKCSVEVSEEDIESDKIRHCKAGEQPFNSNGCKTIEKLVDSLGDDIEGELQRIEDNIEEVKEDARDESTGSEEIGEDSIEDFDEETKAEIEELETELKETKREIYEKSLSSIMGDIDYLFKLIA